MTSLQGCKYSFTVLIVSVLSIINSSCHSSRKTIEPVVEKPATSLEGKWQMQMLFASDNSWKNPPTLQFDVNENSFSGNSGCNQVRGKFVIRDHFIAFDKNIISTKMSCADNKSIQDERSFLSALLKVNNYAVHKDELELLQGEIAIMKFRRI